MTFGHVGLSATDSTALRLASRRDQRLGQRRLHAQAGTECRRGRLRLSRRGAENECQSSGPK